MTDGTELEPLFVLGTTRTGTSAMQLAILTRTRYTGNGEGHLFPIVAPLLETAHEYRDEKRAFQIEGTTANRTSEEDMNEAVYAAIRTLYSLRFGDAPFSDKTPTIDTIRLAPHLHRIWSTCRVIWCQRRGIENVVSKAKKFPRVPFENHCRTWNACLLTWQRVKAEVPSFIEVDQFDLVNDSPGTAEKIGAYLGWTAEEISGVADYLINSRPEKSSESYAPSRIEDVGWDDSMQETFRRLCGPAMEAYGYTYDETYRK